ncbi:MAG: twin-arginine translocase subunit TatC [Deltaproteobacteria bacterium]|nr:twin-arginine translocase subunit TatC [Deltaproteobacteria bacterium]
MNDEAKQPFMSHLEELRKRLINAFIAIGIGCCCAFYFSEDLFEILMKPLTKELPEGQTLIFTGLTEMFFTYLKTALVAGILVASPVVFHQAWKFIAPGLYQNEKRYVIPFVISSTILFVGGALFGYFLVFPYGFQFFLGFETETIRAMPSVKEYFSLATRLLLAFGIVFELPVVMFFLSKMGVVTVPFLKKNRKYAILLSFIIAAILTPPDPTTQCMMAVPLIVLFELGIFVARFARPEKKEEKEEEEEKKEE